MILTSHTGCRTCDNLAVDAEYSAYTFNRAEWTATNGDHVGYWKATTFAGPMGRQYERELAETFRDNRAKGNAA